MSDSSHLICRTPPLNNPLFRPLVSSVMCTEPKLIPVTNQGEVKNTFQASDDTESVCENIDTDEGKFNFPLLSALFSYINSAVSIM